LDRYTLSLEEGANLSSLEWRDRAYEETFDSVISGLETRRRTDSGFAVEDAEGVLRHLYIHEGNDFCSRGMLQDAILAATIAAHEQFIDSWKTASLRARADLPKPEC